MGLKYWGGGEGSIREANKTFDDQRYLVII